MLSLSNDMFELSVCPALVSIPVRYAGGLINLSRYDLEQLRISTRLTHTSNTSITAIHHRHLHQPFLSSYQECFSLDLWSLCYSIAIYINLVSIANLHQLNTSRSWSITMLLFTRKQETGTFLNLSSYFAHQTPNQQDTQPSVWLGQRAM